MPELPDVMVYVEALEKRVEGRVLERIRIVSPFVLRTVEPAPTECEGRRVLEVRRVGKRITLGLQGDLWMVVHLMIAGRLRWLEKGKSLKGRWSLAELEFENGALALTEAGTKRRASMHIVRGEEGVRGLDRGGLEVLQSSEPQFALRLKLENHTLKRALTDPRLFSGIGNAYSDEILHRAKLSPLKWTQRMTDGEVTRLWSATREVLTEWTERLRREVGDGWPEKVTAFREGMSVHGKFGKPCPVCGEKVQRIVYAENECNYCATCQTGGKLLADRGMSKLLRGDWPKTAEEWEERKTEGRKGNEAV